MMNQIPALAVALLLGASPVSGQESGQATPADDLRHLLADPDVVLLKTTRVFLPGRDGGAPRLVEGGKHWLVVRKGRVVDLKAEPEQAVEIAKDEVKAKVVDLTASHPGAVAMPGLCDADSRFFLANAQLVDGQADFGTLAQTGLETWQEGWEQLLRRSGVTAVYVPSATMSQAGGQGAVVVLDLLDKPKPLAEQGALFFRVSAPNAPGNSLTRAAAVKPLRAALEAAKQYREANDKWKKDNEEYLKKRAEFLAYYAKNPMKPGDANERSAEGGRRGPPGMGSGRIQLTQEDMMKLRQVPREQRQEAMRKLMEERQKEAEKAGQAAQPAEKKPEAAAESKAPPRPKAPKKPDTDPAKEALLAVLDGKATLRVEAHRAEEITALLELVEELGVKRLVVVGGTEAWRVASVLRQAGTTVVLTPQALPPAGLDTLPEHMVACAAKLSAEGVPVAFGSAGKERGEFLASWAARAVALGMPLEQALQALTENALAAAGTPGAATGAVVFSGDPLAPASIVIGLADEQGWMLAGENK